MNESQKLRFLPEVEWRFDKIIERGELRACREYEFARESEILRAVVERVRKGPKDLGGDLSSQSPHRLDIPLEIYEQAIRKGTFAPTKIASFPGTPYLSLSADEKRISRKVLIWKAEFRMPEVLFLRLTMNLSAGAAAASSTKRRLKND